MFATRKDQHFAALDGLQQEMEKCAQELCARKEDAAEVYAEVPMSVCVWMVELLHHALLKSQMIANAL